MQVIFMMTMQEALHACEGEVEDPRFGQEYWNCPNCELHACESHDAAGWEWASTDLGHKPYLHHYN